MESERVGKVKLVSKTASPRQPAKTPETSISLLYRRNIVEFKRLISRWGPLVIAFVAFSWQFPEKIGT